MKGSCKLALQSTLPHDQKLNEDQRDDSVGKCACCQAQQPEFISQDARGRKRETQFLQTEQWDSHGLKRENIELSIIPHKNLT